MRTRTRIAIGIILLGGLAGVLWYASLREREKEANTNIPSATTARTIKLYYVLVDDGGKNGTKFGCNDSLVFVTKRFSNPSIAAALTALLDDHSERVGPSQLYNALAQSRLTVDAVTTSEGVATVALKGTYQLGGACDNPRFEQQLLATIQQFPGTAEVRVTINGTPLAEILSGR